MKKDNNNLSRKQILNILIQDYSYDFEQLKHKSTNDLIILLEKRRADKKSGAKFFKEFWVIRTMKRPEAIDNDGLPGTQKIAWIIFFGWVFSFILFGLFIFLMIYFAS